MFCFDLRPVNEIEPWTGADGLSLSWFGLSIIPWEAAFALLDTES